MHLKDLNSSHIKTEYFININRKKFSPEKREHVYYILDKDFLTDCIVINKWSMLATVNFLKTLGFLTTVGLIKDRCIYFNISPPSLKESALRGAAKRASTNLEKYGAINCLSKGTTSYEKRNKTVLEKYGVSNVFASEEIIDKVKKTNLERYGAEYPIKIAKQCNISKPHKKVSDYLNELNISHLNEGRNLFVKFNNSVNKIYNPIPDIYIQSLNIVIEIYGDYWHGNPKIYKENDLVSNRLYDKDLKTIKDIWDKDLIRQEHIESFNIKFYVLWESDINNDKYIEKINDWINIK